MIKGINSKVLLGVAAVVVVVFSAVVLVEVFREKTPIEEETYRLKWIANMGFVGDLYADTYGLFVEENLRINVKPGGPEHDAIRELQTGQAQFGVASADQVIDAIVKGADVVVIGQIYQKNPVQWIYRCEHVSIKEPMDLIGKTIGVTIGDNDETIMKALLKLHNIGENTLTLVGVKYSFLPFTRGEVELFPVYKNTQGVELKRQLAAANERMCFFDPDSAGIHFVANSIVTTSRMIEGHGDVVKRFLHAALRGWNDALRPDNELKALKAVKKFSDGSEYDSEASEKTLREQLAVTRELVIPEDENVEIGTIDEGSWKLTEEMMLDQEVIKKPV